MTDDETMSEFYTRFKDVVNQAYALGLEYDEERLVRKMLRSVNKKLKIKVSTLEDKKKTKNMNLETLNEVTMVVKQLVNNESIENRKVLVTTNERELMIKATRRSSTLFLDQKTQSDEEDSQESEEESDNESVDAFVIKEGESRKGKENAPEEECNNNDTIKIDIYDLMKAYEEVVGEQNICVKRNKGLINTVYHLEARVEKVEKVNQKIFEINEGLQREVKQLIMKCDYLRKENDGLRKGKDKLNEVISIGKPFGDHRGIGYQESMNMKPTTFVKGGFLTDVKIPDKPPRGRTLKVLKKTERRGEIKIAEGTDVSIRRYKRKVTMDRDLMSGKKVNWPSDELKHRVNFKMEWRPKKNQSQMMCNVILCSTCGEVIFRDGAKGKIVGYGSLEAKDIPKLSKVYFVEGLSTNLISISQLCNDKLQVKFTKDVCELYKNKKECVMTRKRSRNNWYLLDKPMDVALILKDDETLLWHTRLGHVNQQNLMKLSK
ncbi:uncharacterized protein LOC127250149 [Andrographis paniculata]|uniref:uncharacterized protein LOC127250149 n=1 Tax=Andrographis paniculata TaxID=175694 RepID=UPI0021E8703D|nr:uncharacterized protein LOC127250149 [Andrographis paniculata]